MDRYEWNCGNGMTYELAYSEMPGDGFFIAWLFRGATGGSCMLFDGELNCSYVKEKMKHSGWNWYIPAPRVNGIPIGDDFVWLLPSGKKPKDGGEPGIDFLNDEMAARQFAVDHFDWGGEFKGIDQSQELRSGKSSRRRGRL